MTNFIPRKGDVLLYGVETTYGEAVTPTRVIGLIDDFIPPSYSRSISTAPILGTTAPGYYKEDVADLTGGSIKFAVQRPEFLEYIVGAASDSEAPGPFTHTVTPADNVGSVTLGFGRHDNEGTLVVRFSYAGTVFNKLTLSADIGDVLHGTLGFESQTEVQDSTAIAFAQQTGETPIIFKGSSITLTSLIATPKNFSFEFNRKISKTNLLNSVIPACKTADEWSATAKVGYAFTEVTELNRYHGSTGTTDVEAPENPIVFVIDNGLETTSQRTLTINGTSAKISDFTFGYGDHATGELGMVYKTLTMTYLDNTANWDAA